MGQKSSNRDPNGAWVEMAKTTKTAESAKTTENFCHACGKKIPKNAVICPSCKVKQTGKVSKLALVLLALFLGGLGIHKFYIGKHWQGVIYLLLSWTGISGIIALIEAIIYIFTSSERLNEKYTASGSSVIISIIAILVGIACLGIIAAIAIPQYVKYRERAQEHSMQQLRDSSSPLQTQEGMETTLPAAPPEKTDKQKQDAKKESITTVLCSNVFKDYSNGKIQGEELIYLNQKKSMALKKSNGTYHREQNKEMYLYLEFFNLAPQVPYAIFYKLYSPTNKLHGTRQYNFTPKNSHWRSWYFIAFDPPNQESLPDGIWRVEAFMNDIQIVSTTFTLQSSGSENVQHPEQ